MMTEMKVLTDLELDAVCGGILNGGAGGAGGAGGDGGNNGATVAFSGSVSLNINALNDQSVNYSRASANGGDGGDGGNVSIRVSARSHH
jgi:hypothetical protein